MSAVVREDPLRAVRAARFLAELPDFTLHAAARREAQGVARHLRRAAVERVREELDKLLGAAAPQRGLRELQKLGLIDPLLPELQPLRDCAAGDDRPDVWTHTLDCLAVSARPLRLPGSHVVKDPASRRILRWALLLHDIPKPETLRRGPTGAPSFHGHEVLGSRRAETLLRRLRLPRVDRKRVEPIFRKMVVDRFAFDVELLYLSHRFGLRTLEVPVIWRNVEASRVNMLADSLNMLLDVARIRWRFRQGAYNPDTSV